MAIEVVEGELQPSEPAGGNRKYARYKNLAITQAGGKVRSFAKLAAGGEMIEQIRRGGEGRWYVAKTDGVTAFVGVRRADGTAVYAKHTNFEPVMLVVGLLGLLGGVAKFGFGLEEFPLTPAVLGPLLLLGWWYFRSQRIAQENYFKMGAN